MRPISLMSTLPLQSVSTSVVASPTSSSVILYISITEGNIAVPPTVNLEPDSYTIKFPKPIQTKDTIITVAISTFFFLSSIFLPPPLNFNLHLSIYKGMLIKTMKESSIFLFNRHACSPLQCAFVNDRT